MTDSFTIWILCYGTQGKLVGLLMYASTLLNCINEEKLKRLEMKRKVKGERTKRKVNMAFGRDDILI